MRSLDLKIDLFHVCLDVKKALESPSLNGNVF